MIRVILVGAAAALLSMWVRPLKSEYGMFLSMAAVLLVFGASVTQLGSILELARNLMDQTGLSSVYFKILLKIMGLAWVSQLASDICREAGCSSISRQIDIYGKLLILSVSLPVITSVIETITSLFPG